MNGIFHKNKYFDFTRLPINYPLPEKYMRPGSKIKAAKTNRQMMHEFIDSMNDEQLAVFIEGLKSNV